MTLAEFLLARIAEDEMTAQEAIDHGGDAYDSWPAQVLAECEAKRRIVEWCGERERLYIGTVRDAGKPARAEHFVPGAMVRPADSVVLRLLALPYADHPDYREEWRP